MVLNSQSISCMCDLYKARSIIFKQPNIPAASQTMGLSPRAFSPTHGSTMLHSLVYIKNMHEPYKPIKLHPSKIYSGEPETGEQHAYITRNFIGYEQVTEVMHIWLKTSERHKVDPRVMKEGIDENRPWVTDDDIPAKLITTVLSLSTKERENCIFIFK